MPTCWLWRSLTGSMLLHPAVVSMLLLALAESKGLLCTGLSGSGGSGWQRTLCPVNESDRPAHIYLLVLCKRRWKGTSTQEPLSRKEKQQLGDVVVMLT